MRKAIGTALCAVSLFGSVDINNASIEELTALKGIGTVKAKAIAAYRKKHCFEKAEELIRVKGIGRVTFRKNQKEIIVGPCPKKAR